MAATSRDQLGTLCRGSWLPRGKHVSFGCDSTGWGSSHVAHSLRVLEQVSSSRPRTDQRRRTTRKKRHVLLRELCALLSLTLFYTVLLPRVCFQTAQTALGPHPSKGFGSRVVSSLDMVARLPAGKCPKVRTRGGGGGWSSHGGGRRLLGVPETDQEVAVVLGQDQEW